MAVALDLAARGVPVVPLRAGKLPVGNCPDCHGTACGGRPNMKIPGPCACPSPCHAWAAATTDPHVLTSVPWRKAWTDAETVAWHPGGAGLTVVDLDHADAVDWARRELPATRTVPTTRGEHWIYRGAIRSANGVRPGVDIKSHMAYARWLGPGTGTMTALPAAVRALLDKQETTSPPGGLVSSSPGGWDRQVATGCRHSERFVRTGLARGVDMVRACTDSGAGSKAFAVAQFTARQHTACPGPCHLDALAEAIVAAAVSVGVPEPYATRAVTRGLTLATPQIRRAAA
ncbi:bifunctional DNA primase/polymerase [Streptomyces diastaticus]|uniref:bifunctional DNA primase/polymerase n=1 Tax=Streptomyces diastaticus TaxID=1956 RepID=UPI0037B98B21